MKKKKERSVPNFKQTFPERCLTKEELQNILKHLKFIYLLAVCDLSKFTPSHSLKDWEGAQIY